MSIVPVRRSDISMVSRSTQQDVSSPSKQTSTQQDIRDTESSPCKWENLEQDLMIVLASICLVTSRKVTCSLTPALIVRLAKAEAIDLSIARERNGCG